MHPIVEESNRYLEDDKRAAINVSKCRIKRPPAEYLLECFYFAVP